MQTTENQATPAKRLKAFFDSTGMSVRDFAKEIGSPEKFRTLYSVFNEERQPNPKLVRQIIERFPQLSFDWIYVGAGNMFLEQSTSMISQNDYDLGVSARVNQAMDRLDRMEFALNELANQITRTLQNQSDAMLTFHRHIDEMRDAARDQQKEMKANRERANEIVQAIIQANATNAAKINEMITDFKDFKDVAIINRDRGAKAFETLGVMIQTFSELKQTVEENNEMQKLWSGHLETFSQASKLMIKFGSPKTKQ